MRVSLLVHGGVVVIRVLANHRPVSKGTQKIILEFVDLFNFGQLGSSLQECWHLFDFLLEELGVRVRVRWVSVLLIGISESLDKIGVAR